MHKSLKYLISSFILYVEKNSHTDKIIFCCRLACMALQQFQMPAIAEAMFGEIWICAIWFSFKSMAQNSAPFSNDLLGTIPKTSQCARTHTHTLTSNKNFKKTLTGPENCVQWMGQLLNYSSFHCGFFSPRYHCLLTGYTKIWAFILSGWAVRNVEMVWIKADLTFQIVSGIE